jgi:hypothetical protein
VVAARTDPGVVVRASVPPGTPVAGEAGEPGETPAGAAAAAG